MLRLQTVSSIEEHICSVADAKKGLAELTITGVPTVAAHCAGTRSILWVLGRDHDSGKTRLQLRCPGAREHCCECRRLL